MTVKDRPRFLACLRVTAELYGQSCPSEEALKLWALLLASYPVEDIEVALKRHMAESPFMPRPADIIRAIDGTAEDRAAAAWIELENAVARCGGYCDIRFGNPAIHYAIEQMGGWRTVSMTFSDFKRRDFERLYRQGERIASWEGGPGKVKVQPYLMGECHASNALRGYALPLKVYGPDGRRLELDLKILEAEVGKTD